MCVCSVGSVMAWHVKRVNNYHETLSAAPLNSALIPRSSEEEKM